MGKMHIIHLKYCFLILRNIQSIITNDQEKRPIKAYTDENMRSEAKYKDMKS